VTPLFESKYNVPDIVTYGDVLLLDEGVDGIVAEPPAGGVGGERVILLEGMLKLADTADDVPDADSGMVTVTNKGEASEIIISPPWTLLIVTCVELPNCCS
jgi:hypothetical protein